MSLSNSTRPDPSLEFCSMNQVQTVNTTGMHGKVCRVNAPPALTNFSSCCDGTWRVRDNCTQYCEVADWRDFGDCVNTNPERTNGSDWWRNGTYLTVCADADEEGEASAGGDGEGEGDDEENAAGEYFCFFDLSLPSG